MTAISTARTFAARLVIQALWPLVVLAAIALAGPAGGRGHTAWDIAATGAAIVSAGATVALSANLLFDAYLFRLIARHSTEAQGCEAVDALLARTGLKRRPARLRGLEERMAGTRRLVAWQRASLCACVAIVLARGLVRSA